MLLSHPNLKRPICLSISCPKKKSQIRAAHPPPRALVLQFILQVPSIPLAKDATPNGLGWLDTPQQHCSRGISGTSDTPSSILRATRKQQQRPNICVETALITAEESPFPRVCPHSIDTCSAWLPPPSARARAFPRGSTGRFPKLQLKPRGPRG